MVLVRVILRTNLGVYLWSPCLCVCTCACVCTVCVWTHQCVPYWSVYWLSTCMMFTTEGSRAWEEKKRKT